MLDAPPAPPILRVTNLHKRFGDLVVLSGVDLDVPRGSVVAIIGKSGTGKSVLLKCLAGIVRPEEGEVCFDGRVMDIETRAEFRRRCSYLFQGNALLDSLDALENVMLPLEATTRLTRREIRKRALEALRQIDLEPQRRMYPSQLSGGQQKRLALARAIVTQPELVLFDEPTAGLDPVRRNGVFEMIVKYQRQFGFTAVVVTHDLPEALVACDHIALLERARIPFQGTPEEFSASEDATVRSFRNSADNLRARINALRLGQPCELEDR